MTNRTRTRYQYANLDNQRYRVWHVRDVEDGICPHCGATGEDYHPVRIDLQRGFYPHWSRMTIYNLCEKCNKRSCASFSRDESPKLYDAAERMIIG